MPAAPRDGSPDVAAANYVTRNVSVLLGNGDGTLRPAVHHVTGSADYASPFSVAVGDFNGDGAADLDTDGVLASLESQLQVLRRRLDAHPERSNLWFEYGSGALAAARLGATVLESQRRHSHTAVRRVHAMPDDLDLRRRQWAASHDGWLAEDDAALAALAARIHGLR